MLKNNELLAPVGSPAAFYAAISSGCNAVYLGLDKFSARAYPSLGFNTIFFRINKYF